MKICQVVTGMIPVRPVGEMGWGAVEKITREYQASLSKLGNEVDLVFINDVKTENYDVVHVHMGNLALELKRRGIPYIFSLHDHHTEHYGRDSYCFKHNLEAMKGSIFSITHAEYLVDYFDQTDKLFYLPHGVNTSFFTPIVNRPSDHRLLMVANNGLGGDYGFDRKGFRYGVEAARELGLPITIVGTNANQKFFEIHKDLMDYKGLNLVANDPTEKELLDIYNSHTIFLHPSMLEAGHPNLTLLESASCLLPMAATYRGSREITGLFKINNLTTAEVVDKVRDIMNNYDQVVAKMKSKRSSYDWDKVCVTLEKMYKAALSFHNLDPDTIASKYQYAYENTTKRC